MWERTNTELKKDWYERHPLRGPQCSLPSATNNHVLFHSHYARIGHCAHKQRTNVMSHLTLGHKIRSPSLLFTLLDHSL